MRSEISAGISSALRECGEWLFARCLCWHLGDLAAPACELEARYVGARSGSVVLRGRVVLIGRVWGTGVWVEAGEPVCLRPERDRLQPSSIHSVPMNVTQTNLRLPHNNSNVRRSPSPPSSTLVMTPPLPPELLPEALGWATEGEGPGERQKVRNSFRLVCRAWN